MSKTFLLRFSFSFTILTTTFLLLNFCTLECHHLDDRAEDVRKNPHAPEKNPCSKNGVETMSDTNASSHPNQPSNSQSKGERISLSPPNQSEIEELILYSMCALVVGIFVGLSVVLALVKFPHLLNFLPSPLSPFSQPSPPFEYDTHPQMNMFEIKHPSVPSAPPPSFQILVPGSQQPHILAWPSAPLENATSGCSTPLTPSSPKPVDMEFEPKSMHDSSAFPIQSTEKLHPEASAAIKLDIPSDRVFFH